MTQLNIIEAAALRIAREMNELKKRKVPTFSKLQCVQRINSFCQLLHFVSVADFPEYPRNESKQLVKRVKSCCFAGRHVLNFPLESA